MNTALAISERLGELRIGDILAFLGLPSTHVAKKQLSGSVEETVRSIAQILNQLLVEAIGKRTASDFEATVEKIFPAYARVMLSLSGIVTSVVQPSVVERLINESLSEIENELKEHGTLAFGSNVADQAIFTVWTLRKIHSVSQSLSAAGKVSDELKEKDGEFANKFVFYMLRSRFSLDCLMISLQSHPRSPIYPEVLARISEGLKSAVNAYAWIKQGLDLRTAAEPTLRPLVWDDEDEALLSASMSDLRHETV